MRRSGFTLIEALVVMIVIFGAFAIAAAVCFALKTPAISPTGGIITVLAAAAMFGGKVMLDKSADSIGK